MFDLILSCCNGSIKRIGKIKKRKIFVIYHDNPCNYKKEGLEECFVAGSDLENYYFEKYQVSVVDENYKFVCSLVRPKNSFIQEKDEKTEDKTTKKDEQTENEEYSEEDKITKKDEKSDEENKQTGNNFKEILTDDMQSIVNELYDNMKAKFISDIVSFYKKNTLLDRNDFNNFMNTRSSKIKSEHGFHTWEYAKVILDFERRPLLNALSRDPVIGEMDEIQINRICDWLGEFEGTVQILQHNCNIFVKNLSTVVSNFKSMEWTDISFKLLLKTSDIYKWCVYDKKNNRWLSLIEIGNDENLSLYNVMCH